jgi:hypothetical protein
VKKQAMVKGALEVTQDVLGAYEMGLTGIVHVETHQLDHVGDVRPGEGEVLESPDHATVGSRVAYRACSRSCQRTDVSSVLSLVKEEVVRSLLH